MSYVIDRRLNGKNKSTVNRQRFLRRYRDHIKKAVEEAVSRRSITDMEHGEQISIPGRDIDEPVLHHGRGGKQTVVHPGNKEFTTGEHIARPQGGGGGKGPGKAGNSGEGMDEFSFQITQEEFLEFMFEDLELPNLVKRNLTGTDTFKTVRAGISNEGNPSRINIIRTLRSAHARRIALSGSSRAKLREATAELERMKREEPDNFGDIQELEVEIDRLKARIRRVPYLDTFDLKYNLLVKHKRFFILLYLFLKRNYDKIDVVFIRHHTSAREVDEEEFFYSRETGGTIVSSALKLMQEIMAARYPSSDWNIYAAQASDGDNWNDDSPICREILTKQIMPFVQYYTYVEITPREHQALWYEYERIGEDFADTFAQQQLVSAGDIYPVFRELFQRRLVS
ncbi:hypothetical protein AO354_29520 [Pseudomonas syringae pv. syringae]|nr:hypothetical protein AO354_29520 [Pseudomonas syringae pv. syringae]